MGGLLFSSPSEAYLVEYSTAALSASDVGVLEWMFAAKCAESATLSGSFLGPKREMVSPWSSNAVDIAHNLGVVAVTRIELFQRLDPQSLANAQAHLDPMLQQIYQGLSASMLHGDHEPESSFEIDDIQKWNKQWSLALSDEEIEFLKECQTKLGRKLTDSELFAFGQINSEHCRHKIFNGVFVIDGEKMPESLFSLIKQTSKNAPKNLVSAYRDNVAFVKGPTIHQFAPTRADGPSYYEVREVDSVLSLKAETHNFPTTVEPFYGASTGSGGEIRDRMAGGRGSIPLAGTAVYMTSYSRLNSRSPFPWEEQIGSRAWRFQSPEQILLKASNGASDFGNKFGQPLIVGSLATYEGQVGSTLYAYDRTVMLAGGVGYGDRKSAEKAAPQVDDAIVVLGGDNYRIGMSGSSVSSVASGEASSAVELSAVQRANPEMQKRVFNVVRAVSESSDNPIRSIHDHGAGGHLNCLSELLDPEGGMIDLDALPIGDPTLSPREILCNESQERMGLLIPQDKVAYLKRVAERERAPMHVVGKISGDKKIVVKSQSRGTPVDLGLEVLFGSSPRTILEDRSIPVVPEKSDFTIADAEQLGAVLRAVFALEGVGCKDWLTNKVDRCVSGRVAQQQTVGPLQLPLANFGAMALEASSSHAVITSIGHASAAGLLSPEAGSRLSIAEALTNLVFAPLSDGLSGVSLSANWMWPAKRPGENARLYHAVKACSEFACALQIPIPTGKDSLSMTMYYPDGSEVRAPGTVIISAIAESNDIRRFVTPDLKSEGDDVSSRSALIYVDFSGAENFALGGSSLSQVYSAIGSEAPDVVDPKYFERAFQVIQDLVRADLILAGHDISSGGMLTTICEMAFAGDCGARVVLPKTWNGDLCPLFSERPGVVLQVASSQWSLVCERLHRAQVRFESIGEVGGDQIQVVGEKFLYAESLSALRQAWFQTSALLDAQQTSPECAQSRAASIETRHFRLHFPDAFTGTLESHGVSFVRRAATKLEAAVIREQGTNGEREMALALYAAGFDVRDVTMSDLVSGREDLSTVRMIAFPGGFANSDVLGAGRGWAGVFRFNDRAMNALRNFYLREDTLSLAVCNGCQLVTALGLMYPEHEKKVSMEQNASKKFESSFLEVEVGQSPSVFLRDLIGARLGIWVAHGEGRFSLPMGESAYSIPLRYVDAAYPMNPNGAEFNAAGISSPDGRHLAMMPHLERSLFPWNWGYYPELRKRSDQYSPWMLAFTAARDWLKSH